MDIEACPTTEDMKFATQGVWDSVSHYSLWNDNCYIFFFTSSGHQAGCLSGLSRLTFLKLGEKTLQKLQYLFYTKYKVQS